MGDPRIPEVGGGGAGRERCAHATGIGTRHAPNADLGVVFGQGREGMGLGRALVKPEPELRDRIEFGRAPLVVEELIAVKTGSHAGVPSGKSATGLRSGVL